MRLKNGESKNNLESHHLVFQKEFNDNKINDKKLHYQKDANYNLVTLCRTCHDDVDRNKIVINEWKDTSNGRELDYYINETPNKVNKYSDDLINYIKSLKKEVSDPKLARLKVIEKFNKKVSKDSILKFWI